MHKELITFVGLILLTTTAKALEVTTLPQRQVTAAEWLAFEARLALSKIDQNISPKNTPDENKAGLIEALPGAIIAARTRKEPNYYYHWVRDSALVVDAYLSEISRMEPEQAEKSLRKILDHVAFNDQLQTLPPAGEAKTGLGEPKFEVDGSHYLAGWGRPQNDGPALRAAALIHLTRILGKSSQSNYRLQTVIRRDLDYIAEHWRDPSVDLWEEVKGDHFYTRMVQHRALLEGSVHMRSLGLYVLADQYELQASELKKTLGQFWNAQLEHFIPTVLRVDGIDYKNSQRDTAVILAFLHGNSSRKPLRFTDAKFIKSMDLLIRTFQELYPINKDPNIPGVAIGRYPEDVYGGSHFKYGNPWPMITLGLAEASYKISEEYRHKGAELMAQRWLERGDNLVLRVQHHAYADGSLSEQIDRDSGQMTSVSDLTWNYAAVLTAARARAQAIAD